MYKKRVNSNKPAVAPLSEEQRLNLRATALRQCLEIIAARTRFTTALRDYFNTASEDSLRLFILFHMRAQPSDKVLKFAKMLILESAENALGCQREMTEELEKALTTETDCLSLAFTIKAKLICQAKFTENDNAAMHTQRRIMLQLKRDKLLTQREYEELVKNSNACLDYCNLHSNKAYYEQVYAILRKDVFGPLELEFLDKYATFFTEPIGEKDVLPMAILSADFVSLRASNLKFRAEICNKIAKRHKSNPRLSESPCAEIPPYDLQRTLAMHDDSIFDEYQRRGIGDLLSIYRHAYHAKETWRSIDSKDQEFVQQELAWLAAEDEAAAQEKAVAKEQLVKANSERRETHRLEVIRDRAEKDAQHQRKALEKQQRHVARVCAELDDSSINVTDTRFTKRAFQVDMEQVLKYGADITDLFAADTAEFAYHRAAKLIANLGGELCISTGSSHQTIKFQSKFYQQVEFVAVGGIGKPHEGETVLQAHNLELFRETLNMVLPSGWQQKIAEIYKSQIHAKWRTLAVA